MGTPSPDRELMSAADVSRTISRIAHQIIEKTALDAADAPRVVLLGIPTRGVTLATRIAEKVKEFSGVELPAGANVQQAIVAAGGDVAIYDYAGSVHAFFNDTRPEVFQADHAALAWERTLAALRAITG